MDCAVPDWAMQQPSRLRGLRGFTATDGSPCTGNASWLTRMPGNGPPVPAERAAGAECALSAEHAGRLPAARAAAAAVRPLRNVLRDRSVHGGNTARLLLGLWGVSA